MALEDDEFEGALSDPDQNAIVASAKHRIQKELDKLPEVAAKVAEICKTDCVEAAEVFLSYARGIEFRLKNYEDYYKALE